MIFDWRDKLPKQLRIGPHRVRVKLIDDQTLNEEGDTLYGQWSTSEQLITINETCPTPSFAAEVMLHEIIHGIWANYDFSPEMSEEKSASVMAPALLQVMLDNANLRRWINQCLKRTK